MDSSVLVFTCPSSLCQRPSCTLLFTAFMKLKLLYTFSYGKSRGNVSLHEKKVRRIYRGAPAVSLLQRGAAALFTIFSIFPLDGTRS